MIWSSLYQPAPELSHQKHQNHKSTFHQQESGFPEGCLLRGVGHPCWFSGGTNPKLYCQIGLGVVYNINLKVLFHEIPLSQRLEPRLATNIPAESTQAWNRLTGFQVWSSWASSLALSPLRFFPKVSQNLAAGDGSGRATSIFEGFIRMDISS